MKINKILGSVETYIPQVEILDLRDIINDFVNRLSLKIEYKDRHTEFLDALTGAQAQTNSTTMLVDEDANFTLTQAMVGMTIKNTTDGSEATIISNTATTILHDALSGGTNNYWSDEDAYEVEITGTHTNDTASTSQMVDSAAELPYDPIGDEPVEEQFLEGHIITNTTDSSSARIKSNTNTIINHNSLFGGTNNFWEKNDVYTISITGSCTTGGSATQMIDVSQDFPTTDFLIGGTITNVTDSSTGTIVAVTPTSIKHTTLSGGTANVWAARDSYSIDPPTGTHTNETYEATILTDENADFPFAQEFVGFKIYNTTDVSTATITSSSKLTVTHGALTGGSNDYWEKDDAYEISITGTHTDPTVSTTIMTDNDADFPVGDCFIGNTIKNITDDSEATITAVTKTTITHDVLTGGTNNYWEGDDVYQIVSQRIPLPRDIISINTLFTTDSDSNEYESKQDITLEDIYEDLGYTNEHCVVKDRIIHFPEEMDEDSSLIVYVSRPYTEQTGIVENTTEIDIPDKYFPLMRAFCIKEVCVLPQYVERYGYLDKKFDAVYEKILLDIATSKNSARYERGETY